MFHTEQNRTESLFNLMHIHHIDINQIHNYDKMCDNNDKVILKYIPVQVIQSKRVLQKLKRMVEKDLRSSSVHYLKHERSPEKNHRLSIS